jgi:hypothetical protein
MPGTGPSLCPAPMPQGVSYVRRVNLYIRNLIPDDMGIPSLAVLALSGWGYADFHAGVNFRLTEFYEVLSTRLLRSSPGHPLEYYR